MYNRLRVLSTDIANSVIGHWEQVGVVVLTQAVKSVFTTGGFDNIDYNPSSTAAKSVLHGTCISIYQNFSSNIQQVENLDDSLNNNITIIICSSYHAYIACFLSEATSKRFTILGPLLFVLLLGDIDKKVTSSFLSSFADDTRIGKK